ncbi:RNA polymerase sigma factor [Kitasatospora sp. NPDC092286]|uniref:RNA polymerase sigma factor n=1 Tax=Kitasatospora sp. NPDC092286 TaxID=3364087 RepID=UPI00382CB19E
MSADRATVEGLLRALAPQALGALVRRYGQFDLSEDAVQEAMLAAATRWPAEGIPDNPRGWLTTVAGRRLVDQIRSERARRRREDEVAAREPDPTSPGPGEPTPADRDDTLTLLFLCCHPALSPASQVALTLRAVGGLTTAEIARAYFVPEPTMAARISRAKQRIKAAGSDFTMPVGQDRAERLRAVLHVLYVIFNEGYTASSGDRLRRDDLAAEAIRLTRLLHRLLPDDGAVTGLLALMLLTDARRDARTGPDGELVPLDEQDRSRWDRGRITEGVALVTDAMSRPTLGPYQLQAAIAALHDEAPSTDETDWRQINTLYKILERISPNPMASLNRAVAVAMIDGPRAGLALLDELAADDRITDHHRLHAVRAHLLERAGDHPAAREYYQRAARGTTSLTERRYLEARAARSAAGPAPG